MKNIVVLSGGVGGARFTRGLLEHLSQTSPARVTVIANNGDDMWLSGLRICPDLDTIMYTLGGGISEEQGWGRANESRRASVEIAAYGSGWDWFTLGDLDLGTHIVRTDLLHSGRTLTEVTEILCRRWQPGVQLLPMSDSAVETHVRLVNGIDEHAAEDLIHFEEWWVRYRASVDVSEFVYIGLDTALPAPGVLEAIHDADVVIVPPSNPVVSVGTILNIPGVRQSLCSAPGRVVGVSPIIGGAQVRGMADKCLSVIGLETSAESVGLHYGARSEGGILDAWLVDEVDSAALPSLQAAGLRSITTPLWMRDAESTRALARDVLHAAQT